MTSGTGKYNDNCRRWLNIHRYQSRFGFGQFAIVAQSRRERANIDLLLSAILGLQQAAALPRFNMLTPFRCDVQNGVQNFPGSWGKER